MATQDKSTQQSAPKPKISRLPLLNSTVAFVLAAMVATTIHELSHLTTARLLGDKAVLYPNFVVDDWASKLHQTITAGVGPLFSIVTGLIVIFATMRLGKGFWSLAVKWFGFLSAQIGFGYLCIAPFVSGGDTGQVLAYWHAGWALQLLSLVLGIAGFAGLLPKLFERSFSPHATDKRSFFQLGMWPWLIGTGVLYVIYNIVISVISSHHVENPGAIIIMGVVTIGVFTPIANFLPATAQSHPRPLRLGKPIPGIVIAVLFALWLILWPAHGFIFG